MIISYESERFPPNGPVSNGTNVLNVGWDDVLWAALTVGRPNRFCVFDHSSGAFAEAVFRLSAVRLAIEAGTSEDRPFRRTAAASNLDPSEKGALSYFLGMTMCSLFCRRLLHSAWMLHVDLLRDLIGPPPLGGGSRPDLVGLTWFGDLLVAECKGRARKPQRAVVRKAKNQAERFSPAAGVPVWWQIGGFAYFSRDELRFQWIDPPPSDGGENSKKVPLRVKPIDIVRKYYTQLLNLIGVRKAESMLASGASFRIDLADVDIRIHPIILRYILARDWGSLLALSFKLSPILESEGFQSDGVKVIAGPSWNKPLGGV